MNETCFISFVKKSVTLSEKKYQMLLKLHFAGGLFCILMKLTALCSQFLKTTLCFTYPLSACFLNFHENFLYAVALLVLIGHINTMALLEPLWLIVPMIHGLYTFIRSGALANKRVFSFCFCFLRDTFSSSPNHPLIFMQSSQTKETKPQKF